jgi:hypothetical protein
MRDKFEPVGDFRGRAEYRFSGRTRFATAFSVINLRANGVPNSGERLQGPPTPPQAGVVLQVVVGATAVLTDRDAWGVNLIGDFQGKWAPQRIRGARRINCTSRSWVLGGRLDMPSQYPSSRPVLG